MAIIGIVFVLLMFLVLTLPYWLDLNRYRDHFLPLVQDELNRKVDVPHIEMMWFPYLGIRLKDMKILDDPTFSHVPFVRVASLDVGVKWKPLFTRRIEVHSISIHQPLISIIRQKDGTLNTGTIGRQSRPDHEPSSTPASGTSMLAIFGVEQLNISEGTVLFEDRSAESTKTYHVEHVELNTQSVRLGDTAKVHAQGVLMPYQLPFVFEGNFGPLQANLDVPNIEANLHLANSRFLAKGHVMRETLNLDITSSSIVLNDFPIPEALPKPIELTNVLAHVQAPVTGNKRLNSDAQVVQVDPFSFDIKLGNSTLSVNGRVDGDRLEIHATSPTINSLDLPLQLPLQTPVSVNQLDLKAKTAGRLVEVHALTAEIFEGRLDAQALWDNRPDIPALRSTGSLKQFHVETIQSLLKPGSITLHGTGVLNWQLKGTVPSNGLPLLYGKADMSISDGQLKGVDLLHQIEKVLQAEGLLGGHRGVTKFSKLQAKLEFQGERIVIQKLQLNGEANDFVMEGEGVVMRDQSMHVNGTLRLERMLSKKIIAQIPIAKVALQEEQLTVPFVVNGNVSQPQIGLDFRDIQQRLQKEAGKAIQKILQGDSKDVQKLLQQGKEMLKGLFGR